MWGFFDGPRVVGIAMSLSTYTPLDSLLDLACRDGVDIRPTLLRVITDLYVQKPTHSSEEETQYVELALGLIDAVDEATRATVAARLSNYAAAPDIVLRKLGVAPAPTETEAPPAIPSGHAAPDPVEEFFSAAADNRRVILTNLTLVESAGVNPQPAPADTISQLECAALEHNTQEFTRLLGRALGVAASLAVRIVQDASGEPIVVAAKALGMKAAVLHRILLVLNPAIGQSVERVFSLALLYDEISEAAAARVVTRWRAAGPPRPRHAPLYWDDERKRPRAAADPAARPNATREGSLVPARAHTNEH